MALEKAKTFMVENAQILFRNFEGREGPYNRAGDRSFAVVLSPELADELSKDGWNVKLLDPREEGDSSVPYIQVGVSFKVRPPRIVMLTSRARTNLDEETVGMLDWASFGNVDLICRAYEWTVGEKSGLKAYLQSFFVTIEEDALERKYAINDVSPE